MSASHYILKENLYDSVGFHTCLNETREDCGKLMASVAKLNSPLKNIESVFSYSSQYQTNSNLNTSCLSFHKNGVEFTNIN